MCVSESVIVGVRVCVSEGWGCESERERGGGGEKERERESYENKHTHIQLLKSYRFSNYQDKTRKTVPQYN